MNRRKNIVSALRSVINREKNTRRNFEVFRTRNGVELVYTRNNNVGGTYLEGRRNNIDPTAFYIERGETNKKSRGKGIGKQMRALMVLAARNAGFKKVLQTSVFMNRNQKKTHKSPPSSYIMKSLGFNRVGNHRNNKGGINQINHVYVFKNKPNNSLLVRSAYPLRTHPLSPTRHKMKFF